MPIGRTLKIQKGVIFLSVNRYKAIAGWERDNRQFPITCLHVFLSEIIAFIGVQLLGETGMKESSLYQNQLEFEGDKGNKFIHQIKGGGWNRI